MNPDQLPLWEETAPMPAITEIIKWVGIIVVLILIGWFLLEVLDTVVRSN